MTHKKPRRPANPPRGPRERTPTRRTSDWQSKTLTGQQRTKPCEAVRVKVVQHALEFSNHHHTKRQANRTPSGHPLSGSKRTTYTTPPTQHNPPACRTHHNTTKTQQTHPTRRISRSHPKQQSKFENEASQRQFTSHSVYVSLKIDMQSA